MRHPGEPSDEDGERPEREGSEDNADHDRQDQRRPQAVEGVVVRNGADRQ